MEPNPGGDAWPLPDLGRITFFDGQRLTAGDLNAAATAQRELRWLHNRSLHSWGIALGFAVSGEPGARQVQVGPGCALDRQGREILLTAPLDLAVPARADDGHGRPVIYYLIAAYPDEAALPVVERRQGEADTAGAVRLSEQARVYWKAQGEQAVEQGLEIVLAQATVRNCRLALPLSLDQRRSARPPQQPFVAAGATPAGQTPWATWTITTAEQGLLVAGIQTTIDTSAARFGTTPEYHAQVRGPRIISNNPYEDGLPFIMEGTVFIYDPARTRFTLRVLLPRGLSTRGALMMNPEWLLTRRTDALLTLANSNWYAVWVGVES